MTFPRRGVARTEQEDYTYLARVFSPDEIQVCEIQAAGPQVSILVNPLLEGCFDNKFEIRFGTQRRRAIGKGMVDRGETGRGRDGLCWPPPRRSVRALLTHTAVASDEWRQSALPAGRTPAKTWNTPSPSYAGEAPGSSLPKEGMPLYWRGYATAKQPFRKC
jgi:hypothetical protein